MAKQIYDGLGNRERQLVDVVYQLGEASVAEVLQKLPDPPSYSSVRKMLSLLEEKGLLKHRRDGMRYVYRPAQPAKTARRQAVLHLLDTFFAGSASDAVNSILDVSADQLNDDDLRRLQSIIDQAKREGR